MKHIKRILCFSLIFALITCVFSTFSIAVNADEYTDRPMSVYIDKKPIVFDKGQTPIIVNDRTLVPLRAISEALDATVYWFQEDKRIQIVKYDKTLTMTIDVPTMSIYSIVSGEATFVTDTALDSPPILTGEDRGYRTYVPLRVIAEAFGAVVSSEFSENGEMIVDIVSHFNEDSINNIGVAQIKNQPEKSMFSTTGRILVVDDKFFLQDMTEKLCLIELTQIPNVPDYWTQQLGVANNNPSGAYVTITGVVQKNVAGYNTIPLRRSVTGIRSLNTDGFVTTGDKE